MTFKRNFILVLALIFCLFSLGAAAEAATISYLGPEGTYTQEACGIFFEKQGSYIPYKTVSEAVESTKQFRENKARKEDTSRGFDTDEFFNDALKHSFGDELGDELQDTREHS